MKKLTALVLVAACSMTSLAWADGHGPDNQGQQPWQEQQGHGQQGQPQDHGKNHYDPKKMHQGDHFAWNGHDFRRGHPAPDRFRGDDYRVNDWRDRGLPNPPSGQHWAYIDGNYVLIAAATGVITSIILNSALHH
ncbi:membrane protein [Mangrovibacter sp. MFB070]|uniref:RcnB family protein n=1 Tax=Mangrovibacter sp. MFB070 TaxID=1224318 RepID=UPI0004D75D12|nr:RcnB family protein [Mangrovibacter sp. MFB070]KEA50447.1 membrane protein [Mangrovibacter sp. MFB070]